MSRFLRDALLGLLVLGGACAWGYLLSELLAPAEVQEAPDLAPVPP